MATWEIEGWLEEQWTGPPAVKKELPEVKVEAPQKNGLLDPGTIFFLVAVALSVWMTLYILGAFL